MRAVTLTHTCIVPDYTVNDRTWFRAIVTRTCSVQSALQYECRIVVLGPRATRPPPFVRLRSQKPLVAGCCRFVEFLSPTVDEMRARRFVIGYTLLQGCGAQNACNLCTDTCHYPTDGICDDGGPGFQYADCSLGIDCTDCGARCQAPFEPPQPPSPPARPPVVFDDSISTGSLTMSSKFSGAAAVGNMVVFAPYHANAVGVYDAVAGIFDDSISTGSQTGTGKFSGAAAVGNIVVFAPTMPTRWA
eukprot:5021472-Prymnesium_polylepis.1